MSDTEQPDCGKTGDDTAVTAVVAGQPFTKIPEDLYIPPDALEVILESFEGPLDLLLYLIRKQNLDILHIPVAQITRQYMQYVELMRLINLDLAAEYLVMAALLAEIKSRMLLPRPVDIDDEDGLGHLLHVGNATQVLLELVELTTELEALLLGKTVDLTRRLEASQLAHVEDSFLDGLEIGQHSAKPPVVHIRHL